MKDVYVFSINTGLLAETARSLTLMHELCLPLEVIATSKSYDTSDACLSECVKFVNSQVKEIKKGHTAVIESNPFLTGLKMEQELIDYHAARWNTDEIIKVHAANPDEPDVQRFPLSCSIFKSKAATGFEIEGNDTHN